MTKDLIQKRNEIINDYKNKIPINEILEKYNIKWSDFYNAITPALSFNRQDIPKDKEEYIVDLYLHNVSTTHIGVEFGVYHKTINKLLDEYGVKRSQAKLNRKWDLNENYFDIIDTPNKAYILGFLYSDGNNSPQKGTIRLSLQESDREILEKIREEIGSEKPLRIQKQKDRNDGYNYCDLCNLEMFSTHMCDTLTKQGCISNKSLKLKYPTFLPDDLNRHFIRGYFDGDGSFCNHKALRGGYQPLVTITSTNDFCLICQYIIQKSINIPCGNIYDASNHNGITKVLSFSGGHQVKTFLDWIYKDAELYLQRKYNKYIEAFYEENIA